MLKEIDHMINPKYSKLLKGYPPFLEVVIPMIQLQGQVVVKGTGTPIPFIRIGLANSYTSTNEEGKFEFAVPQPGQYNLTVRSPMHRPFSETLMLPTDNVSQSVRIEIEPAAMPWQ